MSLTKKIIHKIRPTHPGEMLRGNFMPDYGLTVPGLAVALGVSRQTVNEFLRLHRFLTPSNLFLQVC